MTKQILAFIFYFIKFINLYPLPYPLPPPIPPTHPKARGFIKTLFLPPQPTLNPSVCPVRVGGRDGRRERVRERLEVYEAYEKKK